MDNRELIDICLLGNQEGQKLLYDKYVAPMARLCLRYLKDEEEAQDVLIEGFVKVYENLKKFEYKDDQSLGAWIKKIMINECLMILRKRNRHMYVDLSDVHTESGRLEDASLHASEILGLIQTLPEGYRTIFNLFAIDGYSHREIAGHLGISESASRSQLTHARNKLKELLKRHGWK